MCNRVPPPKGDPEAPLRALIFDSWFDPYRGVIILMRVIDGRLHKGQKIRLWSNGSVYEVEGLGYQSPKPMPCDELSAGEVGFLFANIKTVSDAQDRRHHHRRRNPAAEPLPGFEEIKPMVFAGLYPVESHEHGLLRDALEKLRLNDSAFNFEPENSVALGFGFRCGFLGLLHLEIVQERLEREFNIDLITTAPGVRYRITQTDGEVIEVDNPTKFPDPSDIEQIEEPIIDATVITREEYHRRDPEAAGREARHQKKFEYIGGGRVLLMYELPLNEIVLDFYDRLKIGLARICVARLSSVRLSHFADGEAGRAGGGRTCGCALHHRSQRLRLRARQGADRTAAETDSAADVRGGAAGRHREQDHRARNHLRHAEERAGQMLRRRHLAQTQAAGKAERRQARMKRVGRVEIPQEAFLAVLKVSSDSD